jgi:hypothetical protein
MSLEILTPLDKLHRVSRKVDKDTFVIEPGQWGEVKADGSLENITTDTPGVITKLVMSNVSDNVYESHDIEVGRATTVEDIGYRFQVDSTGFVGTAAFGEFYAVSDKAPNEGKLFDIAEKPTSEAGNYEVVARCEEVGTGYRVFRTVSPEITTVV